MISCTKPYRQAYVMFEINNRQLHLALFRKKVTDQMMNTIYIF